MTDTRTLCVRGVKTFKKIYENKYKTNQKSQITLTAAADQVVFPTSGKRGQASDTSSPSEKFWKRRPRPLPSRCSSIYLFHPTAGVRSARTTLLHFCLTVLVHDTQRDGAAPQASHPHPAFQHLPAAERGSLFSPSLVHGSTRTVQRPYVLCMWTLHSGHKFCILGFARINLRFHAYYDAIST